MEKRPAPARAADPTLAWAATLDIDETGVSVKFQSQTFRAARYCVSKKTEQQDVKEVDRNPAPSQSGPMEAAPWENLDSGAKEKGMDAEDDGKERVTSPGILGDSPRSCRKRYLFRHRHRCRCSPPHRPPSQFSLQSRPHPLVATA